MINRIKTWLRGRRNPTPLKRQTTNRRPPFIIHRDRLPSPADITFVICDGPTRVDIDLGAL